MSFVLVEELRHDAAARAGARTHAKGGDLMRPQHSSMYWRQSSCATQGVPSVGGVSSIEAAKWALSGMRSFRSHITHVGPWRSVLVPNGSIPQPTVNDKDKYPPPLSQHGLRFSFRGKSAETWGRRVWTGPCYRAARTTEHKLQT